MKKNPVDCPRCPLLNSTSFGEFRASPEKIASNILTDRLEKLVKYGILEKTKNASNKLKFDYTLTDSGRQLKPIMLALGKCGSSHIKGTHKIEDYIRSIKH